MFKISNDPKQQVILESAWKAFTTYGFRKTSMDDIARGAGMSRPALYLHYKNKDAIFSGLVDAHYGLSLDNVALALAADESLSHRIKAAFAAQGGPAMQAMMDSPHGLELFEEGLSVASEAIDRGEVTMRAVYAEWLQAEADAGRVVLTGPALEVARTFCSSMKGIKHHSPNYTSYTVGVAQLAALFGAALQPR